MKILFFGSEIDVVKERKEINIIQLFQLIVSNFEFDEVQFFNYFLSVNGITNGLVPFEMAIKFCKKNASICWAKKLENELNKIV